MEDEGCAHVKKIFLGLYTLPIFLRVSIAFRILRSFTYHEFWPEICSFRENFEEQVLSGPPVP